MLILLALARATVWRGARILGLSSQFLGVSGPSKKKGRKGS